MSYSGDEENPVLETAAEMDGKLVLDTTAEMDGKPDTWTTQVMYKQQGPQTIPGMGFWMRIPQEPHVLTGTKLGAWTENWDLFGGHDTLRSEYKGLVQLGVMFC